MSQDVAVPQQPSEALKRIGARLRAAREQKGWRQEDLSKAAGVNKETVNRLELGANGNLYTYYKLTDALEVHSSVVLHDPEFLDRIGNRELARQGRDLESGQPQDIGVAHDPVAARLEIQRLRELLSLYEKEAREVRTATDAIVKVALRLEKIRKASTRGSGGRRRDRKVG